MQDQNDNQVPQDAQAPQEAPQEQPEAQEQAPSQEQAPEQVQTPEQPEQVADVPADDPADIDIRQYAPQQQAPQVTPDEDGYIDPNAYRQSILQEVEQRIAFKESEAKAWASVENKYPEIASDRELRDLVEAQRLADVARGGAGNLSKIAEKVVGKMKSYQQQGKVQAQVSETVQQSAGLQSATANKVDNNKDSDLIERMSRGSEEAQHELISEWLAQGKI